MDKEKREGEEGEGEGEGGEEIEEEDEEICDEEMSSAVGGGLHCLKHQVRYIKFKFLSTY